MEKNSFDKKIFVFMVVVFMVVIQMSTVYAINKDSEGYSLSKGQKFIKGFRFTSTIAKTFFIPTATTAEWSSFLANLPLGISRCTPKAGTWTTKVFGNDCTAAEPACGKTTYGKESWSRTCVGAECGGDCIGATSGHRDCEDVGAACPCIPECPAPSDLCKTDRPYTGDDGCPNGRDCNVKGIVEPIVCPDTETIECGKPYKKDGNICGGGCDLIGTKAVDGGLSDWFHPDENVCIATCDGKTCNEETTGTTLWEKSCTNPTPSCGGDSCSTSPTDWRDCTKTCTATCDYDCVPDCKVANTICVGYSDTSDDGCDNDADCNVIGTKSPVTCPAANTIDCGEVKSKKSNGCGGGCSVTGTKAVDGVWSGWVRANNLCYAYCNPSSCGKKISGSTYWTHTCTDPAPSCGGETCSGSSTGWKYNDCTKTCPACPPDDPPACVASCGITEKKCCDGKSCEFSLYPDYSYSCK